MMRILNAHPEVLCRGEGRFFGRDYVLGESGVRSLYGALTTSPEVRAWMANSVWTRDEDPDALAAELTARHGATPIVAGTAYVEDRRLFKRLISATSSNDQLVGVRPDLLYRLLPFEVTYDVYGLGKVVETVQILLFTTLVFWLLLGKLGAPWFEWAFQIAVIMTLVDTGVALLHAINERVAKVYEEKSRPMPKALRPALAVVLMIGSVYAAESIGLVDLIAKGYGYLTYAFIVLLILPVLTIGLWKLLRR